MTPSKKKPTKSASQAKADTVDAYMAALRHPRKTMIETLRQAVLSVDPRITECVKWNSPSFVLEYDFATINLAPRANDVVLLILHRGAKHRPVTRPAIEDAQGLLRWHGDDRCSIEFKDELDLKKKRAALLAVVKEWIA